LGSVATGRYGGVGTYGRAYARLFGGRACDWRRHALLHEAAGV